MVAGAVTAALAAPGGVLAGPPAVRLRPARARAIALARRYQQAFFRARPPVGARVEAMRARLLGGGVVPDETLGAGLTMTLLVRGAGGEKLGVLKPSAGNTDCRSEVFAFRLAALLGVPDLVQFAAGWTMPPAQAGRVAALLRRTRYQGPKERARVRALADLDRRLAAGRPWPVAVKTWQPATTYWIAAGRRQTGGFDPGNPLAKHLLAAGRRPGPARFSLRQSSRFAPPLGVYKGWAPRDRLSNELATIMLLDALAANGDRFPGGNLHVRSRGETARVVAPPNPKAAGAKRHGVTDLGEVHFLALDNGAGLRGVPPARSPAMGLWERRVSRLDPGVAAALRGLDAFLTGAAPRYREFERPATLASFLGLATTRHPYWPRFTAAVRRVAARLDRLDAKYPGGEAYFGRPLAAVFP